MSNIFADSIAAMAGFEGLRRAFISPEIEVRKAEDDKSVEVLVRETYEASFPSDKQFVFRVYQDGQVIIWVDLGEDLSEVIDSVKQFVADEAVTYGFQYPLDWVLDQEEEEAHLRELYKSSGDDHWVSVPGRLG